VFETWNAGSRYRLGSLRTAAKELQNYTSVVLGVQKVQRDKSGTQPAEDNTCTYLKAAIRALNGKMAYNLSRKL
jgi:hypothetical protein